MSLYKRGKTWHTDFSVNGQRFRQSLDTTDWREAQASEKTLIHKAREGKLAGSQSGQLGCLPFNRAMDEFLSERKVEIREPKHEAALSVPLRAFFKAVRLKEVCADDVRAYQRA